jgi:hypothetical protein
MTYLLSLGKSVFRWKIREEGTEKNMTMLLWSPSHLTIGSGI